MERAMFSASLRLAAMALGLAFWMRSNVGNERRRLMARASADTEIKIGETMPYSGPVSAAGTIGRAGVGVFPDGQCERGRERA